jgi:hypothetical protein
MVPADLIDRIRDRAYDPARRLGIVAVSYSALMATTDRALAGVRERYADRWAALCAGDMPAQERDELCFWTRGGSPEAVRLLADDPRGPLFPPLSAARFAAVEERLGRALPDLLRRVYTEVGDGGFGPEYGIFPLGEHPGYEYDLNPVEIMEHDLRRDPDSYSLRLGLVWCDHGCAIRDWVSVAEPGSPVRHVEVDEDELLPEVLAQPGVPLVDWFEDWLAS